MGLKKIGKATAPRSFGTGGVKITPKNNVSNTLNNVQSTYKSTSRKENAFDKLFDLANEVVSSSLPKSAPKFTLPTTSKGVADMASAIQKQQAAEKERSITAELAFARRTRAGGDVIQDLQKQQQDALEHQFASNGSNFLKDLGWGIGYGAERIGAGLLGAAEGVSDFVGSTGSKALEYLTSLGYSSPNDVSEFFRRQAENYLNTSPTSAYQQSIEDRYQPTDLQRALGDVNETVAAMLPSIGAAALTGGGSAAGQLVSGTSGVSKVLTGSNLGKTIMGVQAAGGGAQEAYQEGVDIGQALTFGAASGLLETTTEALVGGIPGLGKGAASELVGKVISNPIVQKAVDIVGEGGEEAISAIVTPYLQRAIYDPSAENATLEEIAQNAVMGMVAAGVLQGGIELPSYLSARMDAGRNVNTYDAFTQQQASILEQIANEMAAERVSQIPGFERQTTQPQVQTTAPAQPRMQAQNQQQTQAQQSTALLDQLRQQTSTLSNRQAEQVLSDRQAVATLQQNAGLDLSAQTTLSQRRAAVKQSFEQYAAQQQQAQAEQSRADMMNSLGENGKKAFVSAVRQTGDADATYPEFAQAYAAGLSGSDQAADLSPTAQSAYYAGQNDAATRAEVKAPTMTAGFTESEYSGDLSESDRAFYDVLGKATGTTISVVAPTGEGGYNGYYQDGEIRVAADAEEPGQVVVAHEATHRLQEIAPEAYTKFRDYAVSAVAGQGGADALISAYQSRYADVGVTLTQDAAMDEIAADYAQRLMIDEEAIRRVVADDRSLAQKFVDTIKDLIQRVKRAFSGKEARAELNRLETARDLWMGALKKANSSMDSSTESNTKSAFGYSLKGTSQLQRQVQNLQERNEYLKEQMKRSKSIKTDRKKTSAYAKRLLKAYESQYGSDAFTSDLLSIYDEIANAGSDVDMDSLTTRARDVASRILEQSVRQDSDLYNEYSSLRNYLRTTKINVPKSIHADFDMVGGYNQFRKSNMGRMKLSSSDGASIETVYQELSEQYPGLFDETAYTNPADQLMNMADVLDGIQPIIENPYSSDMKMATRFVASEILESYFDIPQQKPTFADRQQARVEAARAAGNRRVAELREANRQNIADIRQKNRERVASIRETNQQRIAQLREQGRQQVKNAIQRERTKRAEQIQALKDKYTSKESAGRERRAVREVRNKIERHVRALSTRLLDPTDSRNVPDELRPPVAALLEAINLESNYTFDPDTLHKVIRKDGKSGGMTGKHLAADDARGVATKRTKAFIDLRNAYQQIIKDGVGDMVIDPALLGDQAGDFQGNFDKVISMYDKRLADMSLSELETVWKTVRAIEHSISTAGKNLVQGKFAGTVEWARAMQSENAGKVQRSSTKRHWTLDLLTPITYFSRFGDSGVEVYRMLRNAQDRQQQMLTDIRETTREIVSPADARKYRYETHEFVTDGGQELTLTTAQIMSIYELSKRKQAQGHLLSGGIYQPEVPGTKIRRGTEAIHLTEKDLATIVGTLTDKQAKVSDELQKIMATTLADWGNEASMKAYGYKKFTGSDYWPISVAREGVKTTVENSGMNTRSISNIGLAKATVPKASNPLNIEDAFATFTQHAGDMTDYAAYLLPMEDASRLFNFRFKDGEGNYTGQTIKGLLNRVGGAQSDSYWTRLVDDIQNGTAARTDSQFSAGIQNIIGKTKGASVGANLRVVVQQPTAFFRAAAVLSPANLSKGVAGAPTKGSGWKKALKWAPIAQRKQIGGFEIGNGVRLETELFGDLSKGGKRALNKLDDISSTPAAKADQITWGRIWNACEWQVSKDKSLAKGSDEYYQATAKLFTRVIDESQVVDGVLQRSQIMRSNSALNKMATSFMGEPTMSLNMMMRTWDSMRYETDPKKRNAARRKFARAGTALIVSGVVNAMVQSLVDAERDKDQDKKYWDRVFSAFTGLTGEEETPWDRAVAVVLNSNVSGNINPLGQIPYVKDVLSLLQGYDVTRMDADTIGDFITAGEVVAKNIGGDGPRTPAYAAKELLNAGAKVFGISIGNLWRDASGIVNAIAVETDNTALMYEMAKAGYNLSNTTNKSRFLDIAFRALSLDDLENYAYIRSELMDKMGLDGEDIASAMRSRLKEKGKEDPSFQLSQRANDLIGIHERYAPDKPPSSGFGADDLDSSAYQRYSNQSASTYRTWANEIKSTQGFKTLSDEGKDKAITMARDLAESIALRDNSGGQFTDADFTQLQRWATLGGDYGVDETEAILFEVACKMSESDKDEEGNTISGSWKENSLEEAQRLMPWLTDRELEYLISNHWTPESEALKELKKAKFLP